VFGRFVQVNNRDDRWTYFHEHTRRQNTGNRWTSAWNASVCML